jgi:hypothetical protein
MADQPAPGERPIPAEAELEASSALFLTELDRLREMEKRKRGYPAIEARLRLAREIEETTAGLTTLGRYQTRLIRLQNESVGAAETAVRSPHVIIDDWRQAERRLHEARVALERAVDEADRLREEHRRAFDSERGNEV